VEKKISPNFFFKFGQVFFFFPKRKISREYSSFAFEVAKCKKLPKEKEKNKALVLLEVVRMQ
jgi:hypothetical protein